MTINQTLTAKILKYSLWGCLYLTLLMPLLVSARFIFPFITLKTIYFRIIVEIAVLLYLLLALSAASYRPKMNQLLWFILGFGAIVFLTSLTGVNPYRSLWGTIERGEGFLFMAHLLVFCFILSQTFKNRSEWLTFFSASIAVSILVALYALGQKYGAAWAIVNSAGDRLTSTLGNASYLGAYALGHFWLSVLLFWQRKELWRKIIFGLAALFEIYILFETQTRGAMLAFILTLFCYFLIYCLIAKNKKIKKIFLSGLVLMIAAVIFILVNKNAAWMSHGPFQRLVSISPRTVTVESRLYAIDSSWRAWQDRFLLGYGWENYNVAFNKYFHPEIYRDNGSQIWFDRAHNTIFDVAVATGVVGLIIYLGIYVAAFRILFALMRENYYHNFNLSLAVLAFLTAHFIQNIFVFDSLPTYVMLFSVFAFIAFLASEKKHIQPTAPVPKPINLYVLVSGLFVLLALISYLNLKPAQANLKGIKGLKETYNGHFPSAIQNFDQAIKMNTYQTSELRQKLADAVLSHNNKNYVPDEAAIKRNFEYAFQAISDNIKAAPNDVQNHLYLMVLYNAASYLDANYSKQVIIYGNQALTLSPTRQQIYFELGRAKINQGKISEGIKDFQSAVALYPKNTDAHWNLLTAYIISKQDKLAVDEYMRMLALGLSEDSGTLERAIKLFTSMRTSLQAVNLYQRLLKLNSDNAKEHAL